MDKIKTILAGIEDLEERISDEKGYFYDGQRLAFEDARELIYQQFPELKESEDERIRKWIVNYIHYGAFNEEEHPMALKAIEWLEKQKEQKPLSTKETELNSIASLEQLGYTCIPPEAEQKPAEWSEEDEKMLKRVLETYTCYEADIRSKDVLSDNDIEVLNECAEEKIWLKGRFKSLCPQPKAEWSEEDERNINTLIGVITAHYNEFDLVRDDYPINARELGDWLKSLHPQPRWTKEDKHQAEVAISFLKDYADKGYENAVCCIDWIKSKMYGDTDM